MKREEPFDAAALELRRGVNLVEASAGTGKTYAIAMLTLRFVVEKELPVEKILIVTFTNAAAKELRGRIRSRLVEARDCLASLHSGRIEGGIFDPTLTSWAKRIERGSVQRAVLLLQQALYSIDQAPIFTIHGFCQRMLSEQALESGQPFDAELLPDTFAVMEEIAEDYWRNEIYLLDFELAALLTENSAFASPQALLASVITVLGGTREIIPGCLPAVECREQIQQSLAAVRHWWQEAGADFSREIREAGEGGYFKGELAKSWQGWLAALERWCLDRCAPIPQHFEWLTASGILEVLNGKKLRGNAKQVAFIADWPFPQAGETLLQQLEALTLSCRVEFAHLLQDELHQRLTRRGEMGFDHLVVNLAAALRQDKECHLQSLLAGRFQVALIDEFQDTDGDQYEIFSRLFGGGRHFLYLIGDPKQAIYSFRGADIHSYFAARSQAERLLTLEKNYRSHPLLVAEINRLFADRSRPFLYPEEVLPFQPVSARSQEECANLFVGETGKNAANGMVYWVLPPSEKKNGRWGATASRDFLREHVVAEISRLLSREQHWHVGEDGQYRPLAPADIAVLVRNNQTGESYSNALANAGIPAVVTSRVSVFAAPECGELLLLLAAILFSSDSRRLKAALTISWFGLDGWQLYQLVEGERQYADWQLKLAAYGQCWQESGFFAMMAALLQKERVFESLAAAARGERRIANIRQLCLLAEEEAETRGLAPLELYHWLLRQHSKDTRNKESELLLESDREAVQIVTMHSAKGLEYGVVFCVDLWGGNDRLKMETTQLLCRKGKRSIADLGSADFAEHRQQVRYDQQAEELRLLYVAVTRAKMRCYLPWVDVQGYGSSIDSFASSLGYLLFPGESAANCDHDCQHVRLSCRGAQDGVMVQLLDEVPQFLAPVGEKEPPVLTRELVSRKTVAASSRLSSFSSLVGLSEYEYEALPDTGREKKIAVPGLPAGPRFGSVVHDLFEQSLFTELAEANDTCVTRGLALARRYGVKVDGERVVRLLRLAVTTPLPPLWGEGFSLARLSDDACVKEMPFYFSHQKVNTGAISELLSADPAVVPLGSREIAGYLTGFVDLLCRWQGRYYIMDYKTNNLGDFLENYQGEQLVSAMRSHNYGLQYWIYTVVLHRYLRWILPDYEYERCFGGVFYLFVRGMTPASPGSGVFSTRPPAPMVEALDHLLGGG